jgi:hypothetical protein
MRSATSSAVLALVLLGACGNYSTEDIAFIEALPTRSDLQVVLPQKPSAKAGAAGVGAVTCTIGTAREFNGARVTGLAMNTALDWILAIVDDIRTLSPSERHEGQRIWGPFPDRNNPGFENRAVIVRTLGTDGIPVYAFSLETRSAAFPAWTAIISGHFVGASGRTGRGDVTLHFDSIRALGLQHQASDPLVPVTIGYDRRGDPRTLSLDIPSGQAGFGLVDFDYTFQSWRNGAARLDYALNDASTNRWVVSAGFDATGAGQGSVTIYPATPPPASYTLSVCWDADGCITAVHDVFNLANYCGAAVTCIIDGPCPTVP